MMVEGFDASKDGATRSNRCDKKQSCSPTMQPFNNFKGPVKLQSIESDISIQENVA